jgi:putative acetyltransferase
MPKPQTATPIIRTANRTDIPAIHRVHAASIRGLCAVAYSPQLIEAWASNPDLRRYDRMLEPACRCLVAVMDGEVCGFGSLNLPESRLASLFVHPDHAGTGVGRLLLRQLEHLAQDAGVVTLQVQASLNARDFYAKHAYRLCRIGKHCMSTGLQMDCAEMEKTFAVPLSGD